MSQREKISRCYNVRGFRSCHCWDKFTKPSKKNFNGIYNRLPNQKSKHILYEEQKKYTLFTNLRNLSCWVRGG